MNTANQQLTDDTEKAIKSFSPAEARKTLTSTSEQEWLTRGQNRAIALFHTAAERVPAYKDFLSKNKIKHDKIKTIQDFQNVPPVDKQNYLRAYPLGSLAWDGELSSLQMISVSSGSSGTPFFWPRGQILDAETMLEHELFLTSFFEMDKYSTLFLICFAMGMYVAGPITLNSVLRMGRKGYPVTAVSPGYSPDDVLAVIPKLAPFYDQVVIAGYPPYAKEIIDKGKEQGIDWSKIKTRLLLAGEGFNETWRTYVSELIGNQSPIYNFLNLYGSADAAVLGHETITSIIARRRIDNDTEARLKLFGNERMPSLLQYHPEHKFFENYGDNEIIFTAPGGIPLVRYNIHDHGGTLKHQDFIDACPELKEYFNELKQENKLWNLPFVYVFGKSDQTAIVYGANVYPENIKKALEHEEIRQTCTGKIIMRMELDGNKDQRFHVDIECAPNTQDNKELLEKISESVYKTLLDVNSEYRVVAKGIIKRAKPIVHLYPYGPEKFRSNSTNAKHKWLHKSE
ncbi:MAG: phenylacetate--CoA ligase family protein [bacterium]|nr:phenylacetate--CoA ligase family protein [bacterium]